MLSKVKKYLDSHRDRQRISIALSKAAAMIPLRKVDLRFPVTWEFSGFSQNGEDGIISVLRSQLLTRNRYFLEIGAADGIDNNTAWLAIVEKYSGLMIEGDETLVSRAKRAVSHHSIGLEIIHMFVEPKKVEQISLLMPVKNPEVLSLDIDGIDFYVAEALLDIGIRPSIFVVEYNSAFGPEKALTIEYQAAFSVHESHDTSLYYGVSIAGWKRLFLKWGYRFVTVESNGVNAVFVDPDAFETSFLENIKPLHFAENQLQLRRFRGGYHEQFKLISDMKLVEL